MIVFQIDAIRWLWQVLHKWWILLGIGALLSNILQRLISPMTELFLDRYDQKVWDVVKHPRHSYGAGGQVVVSGGRSIPAPKDVPYSVSEIATEIGRKKFLVANSLKRLEKRGKVRESHEGWLVKT